MTEDNFNYLNQLIADEFNLTGLWLKIKLKLMSLISFSSAPSQLKQQAQVIRDFIAFNDNA